LVNETLVAGAITISQDDLQVQHMMYQQQQQQQQQQQAAAQVQRTRKHAGCSGMCVDTVFITAADEMA
jgi:hypothetical protein